MQNSKLNVIFLIPSLNYEWKHSLIISYAQKSNTYYVSVNELNEDVKEICRLTTTHTIAGDICKLDIFCDDILLKSSNFDLVKSIFDIFCDTHIVELNFESVI